MLTNCRILTICITLTTAFSGFSLAEGLAERNIDKRSKAVVSHVHSLDPQVLENDRRLSEYGDSVAERNTIKALSPADGNIVDHIHRMHGVPAAGTENSVKTGSRRHTHMVHHHTYKGADIPSQYDTAYKRKRYLFDGQNN